MANNSEHTAGLFDVRNVIGLLFIIYGIILVIANFTLDPGVDFQNVAKNADYNLQAGVPIFIFGILFMVWAKVRPQKVDEKAIKEAEKAREEHLG